MVVAGGGDGGVYFWSLEKKKHIHSTSKDMRDDMDVKDVDVDVDMDMEEEKTINGNKKKRETYSSVVRAPTFVLPAGGPYGHRVGLPVLGLDLVDVDQVQSDGDDPWGGAGSRLATASKDGTAKLWVR